MASPRKIARTLKLEQPLEVGGQTLEALDFYEPQLRDILDAPANPGRLGDQMAIWSALTGQPPSTLGRLGLVDAGHMSAIADELSRPFVVAIGETRSPR